MEQDNESAARHSQPWELKPTASVGMPHLSTKDHL